MHLSLWNPLSHCVSLILDKKTEKINGPDHNEDGSFVAYQEPDSEPVARSWSLTRLEAQNSFLKATYESEDSIPDIHQSYSNFIIMYPKYKSTEKIDELRADEYSHLSDQLPKVSLDYCGFGLFSFMQIVHYWESCTFNLTEITANLTNHAVYGGAEKGSMEYDIKTRIMDYMNIPHNEYELVFTVSRGYAFKLLAESYPFHTNKKLLTMFDHESQSVNWMAQCAKTKGGKIQNASFKWPTLDLYTTDLRKQLTCKKRKKKNSATGLFVFPVQSRVTGAKYSYQWMSLAHQNNWHVLLDAGALGPKDMDSLGLSLFRPEFIITSFYKVFGYDPTGFGCLFIKKSVIGSLHNEPGHTGSGIVKISPVFPSYLSDSMDGNDVVPENGPSPLLPAFSGAYTSDQVKEVFDADMEDYRDSEFEESGNFLVEDVMKSPVFSDDESYDEALWIDLGRSPLDSDNGDSSVSSVPPNWFRSKYKSKRVSFPKAASKITNSPTIMSLHEPAVRPVSEIEEVTETNERSSNLESVIRRETESEFRLLGRREINILATNVEDEDYMSDTLQDSSRRDEYISCRHLDHVNILGLNKTTIRLRYLVNWLVTSLQQLRIQSTDQDTMPLVHIYGPKIKTERGGAVAFNLRDKNKRLIDPEVVQKLAETNGIFLGTGILSHIRMENKGDDGKHKVIRVEVLTASLGFLTNFSDVYKLWTFVAKFMNPSFVKGGLSTVVEDE